MKVSKKNLSFSKKALVSVDMTESSSLDSSGSFNEKQTRRLIRKLDCNLLPFLALLYLLSFLDRTNIGNARLAGLEKSLHMEGLDYNTALSIFFPFYVVAEIPSNIMMKRTRPSIWIPSIMVAWAICTTLMGLVENFCGLLVVRAALGIAEGGLFPGINFYITMYYCRRECGLRMALFFSAATVAGAFGGLLARGITETDGVGGKAGWSWIFILEGLLTFIVAITAFFVMHDYPATANFLNSEERREVVRRLDEDRGSLADEYDLKYFWQAVKDWKIWVHMFITIGIYTPLYSFSLFLPTIVKTLGYTANTAQLMTVPPYVIACLCCIFSGFLGDRFQTRGLFMIFFCLLAIVGFSLLLLSDSPHVRYAGTFLAAAGIYPNVPQGVAWNGNNIVGTLKRAIGIAMHVAFGNFGGVMSAFVYRTQEAPRYRTGHATLIGTLSMSCALSLAMTCFYRLENMRRDKKYKPPVEYSEEEKRMERGSGDSATFFRYVV